jgi:2-oxoglutarate ferredoxin oxidoreductase subunit alpha
LVGEQLTITAAVAGKDVRTLPDFPAEIRAPVGTLAGVSGFQLAMADEAIFTAGEELDVLVALNPAALKHSFEFLKPGGLLILNEDSMSDKDWQKAQLDSNFLNQHASSYQILSFPLVTQTLQSIEDTQLSNTQAKKCKNFYILGLVLWLFDLPKEASLKFIEEKFRRHPQVAQANRQCLHAGYNYALTLELSRASFHTQAMIRTAGTYRQISGIDALALALSTLTVKTQHRMLVAGYPITPASAILHACAQLSDYGITLFQAEDEIAAIGACLGAAYGGDLAMTCTSGPGLDLKTEALGLAVVAELPLVVVDVQRAGASTGLPTKTGQSDLREALFGRHGESPVPVLAANSPSDCFQIMLDAFKIAIDFMTPVIVLLDAYLANAAEPWRIPDVDSLSVVDIQHHRMTKPFTRDERNSRSWNIPGTPGFIHQLGGLEKLGEDGRVSYDAKNHQTMVETRATKIQNIAQTYEPLKVLGHAQASILVIGWGSTYGSLRGAVEACEQAGLKVAYIHLRHLFPLPNDLGDLLHRYPKVIVAELNSGHLCQWLRATYLVDAQSISQCSGQPFSVTTLTEALLEEARHDLI